MRRSVCEMSTSKAGSATKRLARQTYQQIAVSEQFRRLNEQAGMERWGENRLAKYCVARGTLRYTDVFKSDKLKKAPQRCRMVSDLMMRQLNGSPVAFPMVDPANPRSP